MKLSSIKVNGKAIEAGARIDDIPMLPGAALQVRGFGNLHHRRLKAKLVREIPRDRRPDGILDPADEDEIEIRCLAETILLGWDGIDDDDGNPMPFSSETAYALLADPDYLVLRNAVTFAATMVVASKAADQERDAGN